MTKSAQHHSPDISSQKATRAPILRPKDVEAIDQAKEGEANHGDIAAPWLHDTAVRKIFFLDSLRIAGLFEAEIDDRAADPADETRCVCEIDEPVRSQYQCAAAHVDFVHQLNTTEPLLATFRYARAVNSELHATAR